MNTDTRPLVRLTVDGKTQWGCVYHGWKNANEAIRRHQAAGRTAEGHYA